MAEEPCYTPCKFTTHVNFTLVKILDQNSFVFFFVQFPISAMRFYSLETENCPVGQKGRTKKRTAVLQRGQKKAFFIV